MVDVPQQVVVAAFRDEQAASTILAEMRQQERYGYSGVENAAAVTKGEDGKLHIKETGDTSVGTGALVGGGVGLVLGLLAGPAGLVVAAGGAAIGAAAAHGDAGFPDDRLRQLGDRLEPGMSAVVVLIDDSLAESVSKVFEERQAEVVVAALPDEIAAMLDADADADADADDR
jgi:uncharacterized membrane protein